MKAYSQAAVILFVSIVISLGILFSAPEPVLAQSFWDSVTCTGRDCEMCHFVQLANVIVDWLVRVLLLVFGVVAVVAGFGLVTSAGNPAAKNQAKGRMTNAIIGFLIVLGAWMAVDAFLRGLAGDNFGAGGNMAWNKIECVKQPGLSGYNDDFLYSNPLVALGGVEGWSGIGSNRTQSACDATGIDSDGTLMYDCTAQVAQCAGVTGSPTISADGGSVICNPTTGGTVDTSGLGQCHYNNAACSVSALMAAGLSEQQANIMSCIAMTESSGIASTPRYNVTHPGSNSSACGTFQIVGTTWNSYATGSCVGHAANCQNAACNIQVMTSLVESNGYSDWTCPNCNSKAAGCVAKYTN